jgi:molybdate transport system regulatory protein
LSLRLDLGGGRRIGPGKIRLLEEIGRTGSISGAGRALGMSYRRAWEWVEALNRDLRRSVVEAAAGGSGGGASLTEAGLAIVAQDRAIEAEPTPSRRRGWRRWHRPPDPSDGPGVAGLRLVP